MMEEILSNVLQSTFSVAVAAFLLVRTETRLDRLSEAINDLRAAITLTCGRSAERER